jgi:hypothetical protein
MLQFVIGVLAVWRISLLLHAEDGPAAVFVRLRRALGRGFWGQVLDCFQCTSLWVAAPFGWLLGATWTERLLLWPALSGAAIVLERITPRGAPPPAVYIEDP